MRELDVHITSNLHPEGAEEDLRSMLTWIDSDESLQHEVRGQLTNSVTAPAGTMGNELDVLQLAIGSALSSASLAVSMLQWRTSRRHRPGLVLRRGPIEVEIPADELHSDTAARIIALLDQETDHSADDEPAS